MKLSGTFGIALALAFTLGGAAFWLFQEHGTSSKDSIKYEESIQQSLVLAKGLLNREHPLKALNLLSSLQSEVGQYPEYEKEWLALLTKAAGTLADDQLLQSLYDFRPALLEEDEALALRIANRALLKHDFETLSILQSNWQSRSLTPNKWLLLEADKLAMQDKPEASLKLLSEKTFYGEEEEGRLLRLALLNEKEHPKIAWEWLSKALKVSSSADLIHYYRAKLLGNTKNRDLAILEMKEAIQNNPEESFYIEELADEHFKNREYKDAYALLNQAAPSSDELWLSALFLHKVYKPLTIDLLRASLPDGKNTSLIRYLLALGPGQAWNRSLLSSQEGVAALAENVPETLWLETIADLKAGLDINALERLTAHKEMAEIYPELYNSLQAAIAYKFPHLHIVPSLSKETTDTSKVHPFLKQLQHPPFSKEGEKLLASEEAYAALFLAAGWNEAALQLHKMGQIPQEFPKWVPFSLTQALASNRGVSEAIKFAKAQGATPQLTLLLGELYVKNQQGDTAIITLIPLSVSTSEVGIKAAELLSSLYYQKGELEKAESVALGNLAFQESVQGQELLAKIALKRGRTAAAEAIFNKIQGASLEAKSYLATKAFQARDYQTALKLTKELMEKLPHRKDLKTQLLMISQAIKNSSR